MGKSLEMCREIPQAVLDSLDAQGVPSTGDTDAFRSNGTRKSSKIGYYRWKTNG